MRHGTCRLCGHSRPLHNSHVLSAWVYNHIRRGAGGPDVVPIVFDGEVARQQTRQLREHMLCGECERRLKVGEDYVRKVAFSRGRASPLLQLPRLPRRTTRPTTIPLSAASLDAVRIANFAVGLVWRCAVTTAIRRESRPVLGPYEPECRRFLLGEVAFPRTMRLTLGLISDVDQPIHTLTTLPNQGVRDPRTSARMYGFTVAGLVFFLGVGRSLARLDEVCIVHRAPADRFLLAMPAQEMKIFQTTGLLVAETLGALRT
jgi:hypothetical protein